MNKNILTGLLLGCALALAGSSQAADEDCPKIADFTLDKTDNNPGLKELAKDVKPANSWNFNGKVFKLTPASRSEVNKFMAHNESRNGRLVILSMHKYQKVQKNENIKCMYHAIFIPKGRVVAENAMLRADPFNTFDAFPEADKVKFELVNFKNNQ
jgi:hypothetical protein